MNHLMHSVGDCGTMWHLCQVHSLIVFVTSRAQDRASPVCRHHMPGYWATTSMRCRQAVCALECVKICQVFSRYIERSFYQVSKPRAQPRANC